MDPGCSCLLRFVSRSRCRRCAPPWVRRSPRAEGHLDRAEGAGTSAARDNRSEAVDLLGGGPGASDWSSAVQPSQAQPAPCETVCVMRRLLLGKLALAR